MTSPLPTPTAHPDPACACTGGPPWPAMRRLPAPAIDHYYYCPRCGDVLHQAISPHGGITAVHTYPRAARERLPEHIRDLVKQIEGRPRYVQGRLI